MQSKTPSDRWRTYAQYRDALAESWFRRIRSSTAQTLSIAMGALALSAVTLVRSSDSPIIVAISLSIIAVSFGVVLKAVSNLWTARDLRRESRNLEEARARYYHATASESGSAQHDDEEDEHQ